MSTYGSETNKTWFSQSHYLEQLADATADHPGDFDVI